MNKYPLSLLFFTAFCIYPVIIAVSGAQNRPAEAMSEFQFKDRVEAFEKKLGIKVVYKDVPTPTDFTISISDVSSDEDYAKASKLFPGILTAFSKYPSDLIKLTNIKSVAIVSQLEGTERSAPELADYRNGILYFNCSIVAYDPIQNKIDPLLFWTYITHHGFGHMIDYAIKGSEVVTDAEWNKLNPQGFDYGSGGWGIKEHDSMCFVHPWPGFVNKYAMSSPQEDKAEIFVSLFMKEVNLRVKEWATSDQFLEKKLDYMKTVLSTNSKSLDKRFWEQTHDIRYVKQNSTWLTPLGWLPSVKSGAGGGHVEMVNPGREKVVFGVMLTGKTVGTLDTCIAGDTVWFAGHVGDVIKKLESPSKGWDLENCKSVTSMTLWGVWASSDGNKVWICGGDSRRNGASIWASENGGRKWKYQFNTAESFPDRSLLSTDHLNKFFFFDGNNGFAVGGLSDNSAVILRTSDGKTWQTVYRDWPAGTDDEFRSVWFADSQHGCAVGHFGAIVMTYDGGKTWEKVNSGTEQYLYTVRSIDRDIWFISAASGLVLKSTDYGKEWEQLDAAGPTEHLYALAISNGKIWVGGEGGAIYMSDDLGENWTKQKSNISYPVHSISMLDGKRGVAACASNTANLGALLFTYNGGE